ncbi:DUF4169 family protein [Jhaorihella thermophila]|uniref:DUF4169 domain-containing protein n=1 Tax=Jhaorihella thermophila TaxID=488547 RepID=A0A1H5Y466_9RHOB|nr:DUF4169 family protein [Jhaorihella thermophila]SEG18316.1 protein of unknown function [Jhaorihella thermophila]
MTARIVNLRTVRKQRIRAEKKARADENAARFGRTRAQRELERAEEEKARRHLDRHRKDDDGA